MSMKLVLPISISAILYYLKKMLYDPFTGFLLKTLNNMSQNLIFLIFSLLWLTSFLEDVSRYPNIVYLDKSWYLKFCLFWIPLLFYQK